MFLENVELLNVGALEKIPGLGKNGLVRVPEKVRNSLNNRARFIGMYSAGCEVQFVSDAPNIDLYISCIKPEFANRGEIRIFKGNIQCGCHEIEPGKVHNIRLNLPPRFNEIVPEKINNSGYSSDVWRIVCNAGATYVINDINTHGYDIRPPKPEEKPKLNWLAYGSSITNSNLDGYVHVAAQKLRVQVQNKGFSGACQIEKELVDYMVDKCEWDFSTCELGVNMRGRFSPEAFEQRASYLIDRFSETGKSIFIISIFPNWNTPSYVVEAGIPTENEKAYNTILAKLVEKKNADNLYFIPGYTILDDFNALSGDFIHPTAYGHAVMGTNLAGILNEKLNIVS